MYLVWFSEWNNRSDSITQNVSHSTHTLHRRFTAEMQPCVCRLAAYRHMYIQCTTRKSSVSRCLQPPTHLSWWFTHLLWLLNGFVCCLWGLCFWKQKIRKFDLTWLSTQAWKWLIWKKIWSFPRQCHFQKQLNKQDLRLYIN